MNDLITFSNKSPIFKHSVGFDDFFDRMFREFLPSAETVTYPPYNIIKEGDHTRIIELALAGYDESDIEVTVEEDNLLCIRGGHTETVKESSEEGEVQKTTKDYIYRGVASRRFERKFRLAENAEVNNATFKNGMLSVSVTVQPPPEPEIKKIPIKHELTRLEQARDRLTK